MYENTGIAQVSPILSKTDELTKELSELQGGIKALSDRLSPIRRKTPKIEGKSVGGEALPLKSPVMERLEALNGQIHSCLLDINELMKELEI
jgi:hypothetical protein